MVLPLSQSTLLRNDSRIDHGLKEAHEIVWQPDSSRESSQTCVIRHCSTLHAARETLFNALKPVVLKDVTGRPKFVPLDVIGRVINEPNVRRLLDLLPGSATWPPEKKDQVTSHICHGRNGNPETACRATTATLIRAGLLEYLVPLIVEDGVTDACGPMTLDTYGWKRDPGLFAHCHIMPRTLQTWTTDQRQKFDEKHIQLCAPLFVQRCPVTDGGTNHYVLPASTVWPWLSKTPLAQSGETKEERPYQDARLGNLGEPLGDDADTDGFVSWASSTSVQGVGGFSTVSKIEIHRAHFHFDDDLPFGPPRSHNTGSQDYQTTNVFALKTLEPGTSLKAFQVERDNMIRLRSDPSKQLVKMLASLETNGQTNESVEYHFIFPLADYTLWDLWKLIPHASKEPQRDEVLRWMLTEFTEVADTLKFVHSTHRPRPDLDGHSDEDLFGYHGDIKPKNFVLYKRSNDPSHLGSIFLADFGLTKFSDRFNRSNIPFFHSSITYQPPENDASCAHMFAKGNSRKSDMWCLGVCLLECIIWFLHGWQVFSKTFMNDKYRLQEGGTETMDKLYQLVRGCDGQSVGVRVKPCVADWVQCCIEHEECTLWIRDLLEIILTEMLITTRDARITSERMERKLRQMKDRVEGGDTNYLLKRVPQNPAGRNGHLEPPSTSQGRRGKKRKFS